MIKKLVLFLLAFSLLLTLSACGEAQTAETAEPTAEPADLNSYIGNWQLDSGSAEAYYSSLTVREVTQTTVTFDYSFYQMSMENDLTATLTSGNTAVFTGDEKGRNGTLTFLDCSVRLDLQDEEDYSSGGSLSDLYGGTSFTYCKRPWQEAYKTFVSERLFLMYETESDFDLAADAEYDVGLYDINADGTPELIISNGYGPVGALSVSYCYYFSDGIALKAGVCPSRAYYLEDSPYTGLFEKGSETAQVNWWYYSMADNRTTSELVFSELNGEITQRTVDDALFIASQQEMTLFDSLYSIDEIESMGWDSFVGAYSGS